MRHPHIRFLLALGLIGPLLAMIGMTTGGLWRGVGLSAAGTLVAVAAARSWLHSRNERDVYTVLRWRMMAVTATVTVAAALLAVAALVWVVAQLLR